MEQHSCRTSRLDAQILPAGGRSAEGVFRISTRDFTLWRLFHFIVQYAFLAGDGEPFFFGQEVQMADDLREGEHPVEVVQVLVQLLADPGQGLRGAADRRGDLLLSLLMVGN